jgi:hypothetical protein
VDAALAAPELVVVTRLVDPAQLEQLLLSRFEVQLIGERGQPFSGFAQPFGFAARSYRWSVCVGLVHRNQAS